MRDILVVFLVFATVPFTFVRPHIGILTWTWISLMNPHRLTYGFAYSLRIALLVGVCTLVGWVFSREPKRPPSSVVSWLLAALTIWVTVTTCFAFDQNLAWEKWNQVIKILAMTFVTMCLLQRRERIDQAVWAVVLSIGFYGIRGGLFTVLTGGNYRVYGPEGSFIEDNNQLGLALVTVLPLAYYLTMRATRWWLRTGLLGLIGLTAVAALGTYSRGAMLGLSMVLAVLWWRSPQRIWTAVGLAVLAPALLVVMPEQWWDRMATISNYEQDDSARGRLDAWEFAMKVALDHPLTGGGFRVFYDSDIFLSYVPDAPTSRNAHSIYFEVLGENGFVGLGIFLALLLTAMRTCQRIIRSARGHPDLAWADQLARMIFVSLIGYATAGAFLNLGFFDLYYTILAILVATDAVVRASLRAGAREPVSIGGTALPASKSGALPA